jgi:hypothetical protein
MSKLVSGAIVAFQYFPFIVAGVNAIEQVMPTAPSETKKAAILSAVGALAKVGEAVPEAHVQVISVLIDTLVAAFNATGWFTHTTPTPVAK